MSAAREIARLANRVAPEVVRLVIDALRRILAGDHEGAARAAEEAARRTAFVEARRARSRAARGQE